jgi:hypothetical protein
MGIRCICTPPPPRLHHHKHHHVNFNSVARCVSVPKPQHSECVMSFWSVTLIIDSFSPTFEIITCYSKQVGTFIHIHPYNFFHDSHHLTSFICGLVISFLFPVYILTLFSGVPGNFFRGVSTNSVEDRGQRVWGSGGGIA